MIFRALRLTEGAVPAWAFARQALRAHPSLLGLDRLLEVELGQGAENLPDEPLVPGADLTHVPNMLLRGLRRLDIVVKRA